MTRQFQFLDEATFLEDDGMRFFNMVVGVF